MSSNLFIGAICGTSLDAIDVALVKCHDDNVRLVKTYSADIREDGLADRIKRISLGNYDHIEDPIEEMGALHREVGIRFGHAINEMLEGEGGRFYYSFRIKISNHKLTY